MFVVEQLVVLLFVIRFDLLNLFDMNRFLTYMQHWLVAVVVAAAAVVVRYFHYLNYQSNCLCNDREFV